MGYFPRIGNLMKRDLTQLPATVYDVLIVGGGIYGAALAREAATHG